MHDGVWQRTTRSRIADEVVAVFQQSINARYRIQKKNASDAYAFGLTQVALELGFEKIARQFEWRHKEVVYYCDDVSSRGRELGDGLIDSLDERTNRVQDSGLGIDVFRQ